MTKIILTRHGDVEGIKPERFRGRTELPLTELGQAQAKAVAARIAKTWNPAKVYTSPMGRCVATGQEIARACRVASEPIEVLNDLDYGQWQWRTYDEVRATWPELFAAWHTTPHLVRYASRTAGSCPAPAGGQKSRMIWEGASLRSNRSCQSAASNCGGLRS
jgi:phosphoserine phosphatase